ncbi:MAG: hypothetical protein GXO58_00490 [Thermodesulfobacteria bacterium]|nr:hypothetical protein [Thermodesulfobacteriota bacterium]
MAIPLAQLVGYFLLAFCLSAILTPLVIVFAKKTGLVAMPRKDRWHDTPTALYGGTAIFLAFVIPFVTASHVLVGENLYLLVGAIMFFMIGLLDDFLEFTPQSKFIAQLICVVLLVGSGLKINLPGYPVISICLSVFWLLGMANALNILDNMDGLSSGITMIASLSLAAYGVIFGNPNVVIPSVLLAGACLGFFMYNFKPAKIFMGDCGSLFLGFMLGALAIVSTHFQGPVTFGSDGYYAGLSNVVLMLAVPISVLIIPIFDTALVSFSRLQAGRSISQGGKDHTSHRLVLLGLSEERAVLTLMVAAAIVSVITLYMASHSMEGLLAVLSITVVVCIFFGVFLSYLNNDVYDEGANEGKSRSGIAGVMSMILNKRQILQVCVDLFLLTVGYYTAYLLKFDGEISPYNQALIEKTLPLVLGVKVCCLWAFGLYRGQWRFASLDDTFKIIKAVLTSSAIIVGILVFRYRFYGFSRIVFFLDAVMTFLLIGGIRFLLRMFNEYFVRQAEKGHSIPILIYGAGDGGDLFLRELRKRKNHDYMPVGFLDDDKAKHGQEIHGVKVLGSGKDLEKLVKRHGVRVVFVAILSSPGTLFETISERCSKIGVKCVQIRPLVVFEDLDSDAPAVHHQKGQVKVLSLKKTGQNAH